MMFVADASDVVHVEHFTWRTFRLNVSTVHFRRKNVSFCEHFEYWWENCKFNVEKLQISGVFKNYCKLAIPVRTGTTR